MNTKNSVLDSLLPSDYAWLRPQLEEVELQQGDVINASGERVSNVYFPTLGLLSWTISTQMGNGIEVGVVGKEGLSGVTLLLAEEISPWTTEVQLPGRALKLPARNFIDALERSQALQQRTAAYTYFKMVQLTQSALCNRFHSAEARLCRWLLAAQAQTGLMQFSFTQDILAQMIGTGRPTVSLTLGILQTAGLVRAHRGEITVLDQAGLEAAACECHQVVQAALRRYLKTPNRS